MAETTTIYVTKGVEKYGVRKAEARITFGGKGADAIGPDGVHRYPRDPSYWGKQFYLTLDEAIADAEKRRIKRIASLEHQLGLLRALDLSTAVEG